MFIFEFIAYVINMMHHLIVTNIPLTIGLVLIVIGGSVFLDKIKDRY